MFFLRKIELYIPYLLPLFLIFSRTIADITVISISILFIYRSFLLNDFEWLKTSFFKITFLFFIYLISINTFFSINPLNTFLYGLSFIRWPLFSFAIFYWIFKNENSFINFIKSLKIILILFLLHIWYQYFTGSPANFGLFISEYPNRLLVPFTNNPVPGRFLYLYGFTFITIYLSLKKIKNEKINVYFILLILLIGILSTFITGERMSFLIFLSSSLFFLTSLIIKEKKYFLSCFSLLLIIAVLFVVFYYIDQSKFYRIIFSSYKGITNFNENDYAPVLFYSLDKWYSNIFVGGGLQQFKFIPPSTGEASGIFHGHNLPLNLLVETGLFGLILFYSIVLYITYRIVMLFKLNDYIVLSSFLILIYINFFPLHTHFKFSHNWINATTWLIIGLIFSLLNLHEQWYKKKKI